MSRVLPYSDFVSLFIRLPIAHAVATGKGVKIAVLQRSNDDNVRLMIRRVAPDADALGYPVGGGSIDPADLSARFVAEERRIVVIPDVAEWPIDDMKRLATHLVSAGLLVIIPSDLSEDTPAIETVNALHNLGAITVGRVDRQSTVMEPGGEAEMPFNARIRDIETDVFTTVGLYNTLDTNPVATAAGVAALVLERWPDLDGGGIREKIVDGARNVWQATSLETGQWQNKGIRVDPVTTEYTPTGAAEIFRFRVLDAAGSLGVDTAIPWFLNMLNLQEAWKITKGDGTTVAVSDQGFHINHPAIKDSIIRTANFGPVTFDSPKQNFHGTDMSRILHAVAPGARLIPMLCSRSNERGSSGLAGSIAESFRFAAREKVDVVTASWAGQFNTDPDLLSAIQEAVQQGTTVSWFHYPDEYPGVLRSEFTYNGSGETPVLGFADRFLTDPPGFHPVEIEAGLSGTAPQLAGLAALAKSVNAKLTPAQIQQLIRETSTPIGNNVLIPDACRLVVAAKGTQ